MYNIKIAKYNILSIGLILKFEVSQHRTLRKHNLLIVGQHYQGPAVACHCITQQTLDTKPMLF